MIQVKYAVEGAEEILIDLPFKQWKFPVGEVGVKIDGPSQAIKWFAVHWVFESHDEFFVIANLADAIYEHNQKYKANKAYAIIHMPYLPYSRQDRVCHDGESFALSVFAHLINSLFDEVITLDVHNEEVTGKLFPAFLNVPQDACAAPLTGYDWFVAPDAGAAKKIFQHADVISGKTKVLTLEKTRIDGKVVYNDLPADVKLSGKVCVVDDLCDGGATFISVSRLMHNQSDIDYLDLYVTHGFFTQGIAQLNIYYDNIIAYKVYNESLKNNPFVKELSA